MNRFPILLLRCLLAALLLLQWPQAALAGVPQAAGPAALRAKYTALRPVLADNPFRGPLYLESLESPAALQGEVHAVVEHPFGAVSAALGNPQHWCDVMILHLNTKYCRRTGEAGTTRIELRVGKKHDQPLASATLVAFAFRAVSVTPEYLAVELEAPDGPFDTSDYRILLEAVPLDAGRTFLHMGYSFSHGAMSRMAMRLYLSTIGRDKVGFTPVGKGQPGEAGGYIGGLRGLVERNTMRYYLAIDAYLDAIPAPPAEQQEKRLAGWFNATEKYAKQLHEVDREDYLSMKRREIQRQQQTGQ